MNCFFPTNKETWLTESIPFFHNYNRIIVITYASYIPVVFSLKWYMSSRKPFDLRYPLIMWNWFLAIFSLIGAVYLLPVGIYQFTAVLDFSMWRMICDDWCFSCAGCQIGIFLVILFTLSKVLEFGDSIFIVLRKKPLIFLHWYHHAITGLFAWYWMVAAGPYSCSGYFYSAINYSVHTFMYTYYALRAHGYKPQWDIYITTVQIAQMVIGMGVLVTTLYCRTVNELGFWFGFLMYLSFFLLFCQIFYNRYIKKKPKKA